MMNLARPLSNCFAGRFLDYIRRTVGARVRIHAVAWVQCPTSARDAQR